MRIGVVLAIGLVSAVALRPKDKPMPYRLLLLYEKTGSSWQIVAAHFSVVT